jgi:farnesyl-diphosphate farnesyltransferase
LSVTETADVEAWSGKDRGDENFPVGSLLIRPSLRKHIHAFYAFARNADDIGDAPNLAPEDKLARLDVMEDVLRGRRHLGSPSALRLRESLAKTGVTPQHALDLLVAFRRDATKQRYADWWELYDYCQYSAVPVGRYVLDLHGEGRETHAPSDALCTALQVLNHLQDCAKDLATLDRCYLPLDLMDQAGARVEDLRRPAETPALRMVFQALLEKVEHLNRGAGLLPRRVRSLGLRAETGAIVGLSRRLEARLHRGDPLATRVKLTRHDAAGSVLTALRYLVVGRTKPIPREPPRPPVARRRRR